MSVMTAPITKVPPTSALLGGTSWKASHTQKGMSGDSNVAIKDACADGNCRDPRTNSVRPMPTCRNPKPANMTISLAERLVRPCANGTLTRLPMKFDNPAAATIGVCLYRRMVTVMAAIARTMEQAKPTRRYPIRIGGRRR